MTTFKITARLRRHRLRRLAAAGQRHVDSGADRGRAARARRPRRDGGRRGAHRRRRPRAAARSPRSRSRAISDRDAVVRALNAHLPHAIRVLAAEAAPAGFHPRFGARAKTYRYRMWNDEVMSPFDRAYAWHVPGPLDVEAMARGGAAARRAPRLRGVPGDRQLGGDHGARNLRVVSCSDPRTAMNPARSRAATASSLSLRDHRHRLPPTHGADHRRIAGRDRARPAAGRVDCAMRSRRAIVPRPDRRRRRTDCFWCESTTAARLRQGPKSLYTRGLLTKEP